MASAISDTRTNLHAALLSRFSGAGEPQVTFGAPDAYEEQEVVALLGVEAGDEDDAVLGGARPREESFVLVVAVKVHGPEDDAATVDARGWEIADGVRAEVYDDRTIGGALSPTGWARVASQTSEGAQAVENAGWVIYIEVRVLCRARIS